MSDNNKSHICECKLERRKDDVIQYSICMNLVLNNFTV